MRLNLVDSLIASHYYACMVKAPFENPFRPGAGHPPPYLAGREPETREFVKLLDQSVILENPILTGLRGVGKTVLLDTFKPLAIQKGWRWTSTDLSESASISEENLATRVMADLAVVTSGIVISQKVAVVPGFTSSADFVEQTLTYEILRLVYDATPGLVSDKLKEVLEFVWQQLSSDGSKGLILAYDEAQNLADYAPKGQYPLSTLLDVFQSIQKKGMPLMLVLTGLPTLFPKLVEARTFSERMFHVLTLTKLNAEASREAIVNPTVKAGCPVTFIPAMIDTIIELSNGYPYFIQFMCREIFDSYLQAVAAGGENPTAVSVPAIVRKLDNDFFAGRWSRTTDRQRELMEVISELPNCDEEFTVQEIVERSKSVCEKPFSSSHVNQMLFTLSEKAVVYKNRFGKYSFAVPLLGQFIRRQKAERV
jgi:hypothetical protein